MSSAMYLSKVILNMSSAYIRKAINDRNIMHKDILSGIYTQRAESHVLYRVSESVLGTYLYVQSDKAPDWSHLAMRGYVLEDMRKIDAVENLFKLNTMFTFNVMTNPRKVDIAEGKKIFIKDPIKRMEWLNRKADQYGFELLSATEMESQRSSVHRSTGKFNLFMPVFEGTLRITDPDKFKACYRNGLGPGKAYGCGMLLLGAI